VKPASSFLLAFTSSLVIAACSNLSNQCIPGAGARPAPPMLVMPSPGATAIATNIGSLFFDFYRTDDVVTLTTKSGVPVISATMIPAAEPLPSSLPTPAGVVYGTIAIPTLSPATVYSVSNTLTVSGACGFTETGVSSFTTR